MMTFGAFFCAFTIGFYHIWELTLLCLLFVPIIILITLLMMKIFTTTVDDKDQKARENSGKIATEAMMNIRTVTDLGQEENFSKKYDKSVAESVRRKMNKVNLYGFLYGANIGIVFMMYAGVFFFSAWLLQSGRIESSAFEDIFKVLLSILYAAMTANQIGSMAPNYGESKAAASRIQKKTWNSLR